MIAWYDRYLFYIGISSYLYILSHIIPYDGTYGEYMYFFLTKIEFYSLSVIFGSRISWWTTWAIQILIWASSRSADCPPVESLKVMWKPYHVKQLLACYICVSVCVCVSVTYLPSILAKWDFYHLMAWLIYNLQA